MSNQPGQVPIAFELQSLELAVGALGEALNALEQYERHRRPARPVSRAAIREKARTGRLKPHLGAASPTGHVGAPAPEGMTGPLPAFDEVERLAAAAIAEAAPTQKDQP